MREMMASDQSCDCLVAAQRREPCLGRRRRLLSGAELKCMDRPAVALSYLGVDLDHVASLKECILALLKTKRVARHRPSEVFC
jgi:hypothetical protein